jgi:transcription antitermination protein NusB
MMSESLPNTAPRRTKSTLKSPRTRAREFAIQALYQHLVGQQPTADIDAFTRDLSGFNKCDSAHYDALLYGCVEHAAALDTHIEPLLDRRMLEISPVEHAILWVGVYEFLHCLDVPWRVVLNECIELAKDFGGTDGHKYVNGVLNALAPTLRTAEVERDRQAPAGRSGRVRLTQNKAVTASTATSAHPSHDSGPMPIAE